MNIKFFLTKCLFCFCLLGSFAARAALQDPTQPPTEEKAIFADKFVVSAIIISPDRQLAVINDHMVRVGDVVEGRRVISIDANAVVIERQGGTITLPLLSTPKQPEHHNAIKHEE